MNCPSARQKRRAGESGGPLGRAGGSDSSTQGLIMIAMPDWRGAGLAIGCDSPEPSPIIPRSAGSSAAWLARSVRDAEVGGSNPLSPTQSHEPAGRSLEVPNAVTAPEQVLADLLPVAVIGSKLGTEQADRRRIVVQRRDEQVAGRAQQVPVAVPPVAAPVEE